MKNLISVIFVSLLALSNAKVVFAESKNNIEVCSNLSASVRLIASDRDSGKDYKNLKSYKEQYKIDTANDINAMNIIKIVENTPFLKPNVLSNAFASACMSKEKSNTLNLNYYKKFEGCNPYTENEELVFKCVTNIVSF